MFDWNDLRFFLAVARTGSTLAAGRSLKVAQATVSRRITMLEEGLGTPLFVRSPSGYTLSVRGQAMLPHAEAVEREVEALQNSVAAEGRRLSGTVRLTTVESAANVWLMPAMAAFRAKHPAVVAEIIVDDRALDIARGEADIAIRFGNPPQDESLIIRRIVELHESVYVHRDLAEQLGFPNSYDGLTRFPFISFAGPGVGQIERWVTALGPDMQIVHRANTLSAVISAARAGMGAAVMPCLIGDTHSSLVRLFPPIPELTTPGWLVSSASGRQQPNIRALLDHIGDFVRQSVAETEARYRIADAA
ncbi:MAG: LysR family transcriptional regulator [Sphingorhabdus sp.]|uniref:LysR family transcriptional regulator n=1 Tax=Sphingorhabdus sp. TaxID=1902408 RepID=UPI003C8E88DE